MSKARFILGWLACICVCSRTEVAFSGSIFPAVFDPFSSRSDKAFQRVVALGVRSAETVGTGRALSPALAGMGLAPATKKGAFAGVQSGREGGRPALSGYGPKCDGLTDDAPAINSLLAQVSSLGGGSVFLPGGTCRISTPISSSGSDAAPVRLVGQGMATVLEPTGPMAEMIEVKAGFFDVQDVTLQNVHGYSLMGICENKPWDNLSNNYERIRFLGFNIGLSVYHGDAFRIEKSLFLDNKTGVSVQGCLNAIVDGNTFLGGNGIDFPTPTFQHCEGVVLSSNKVLTGVKDAFGLRIMAGLQIDATDNIFDQTVSGPGVILDGATPLTLVTIKGGYVGAQSGAAGATNGLQITNGVLNLTVSAVSFVGWPSYDVSDKGSSNTSFDDLRVLDTSNTCNMLLADAAATSIKGGNFANATCSITESGTTETYASGAHFAGTPHRVLASQYISNYGDALQEFSVSGVGGMDRVEAIGGNGSVTLTAAGTSADTFVVLQGKGSGSAILGVNFQTKFACTLLRCMSAVPMTFVKSAVSQLPAGCAAGDQEFATNGRNNGEKEGRGTGLNVSCNSVGHWIAPWSGVEVTN